MRDLGIRDLAGERRLEQAGARHFLPTHREVSPMASWGDTFTEQLTHDIFIEHQQLCSESLDAAHSRTQYRARDDSRDSARRPARHWSGSLPARGEAPLAACRRALCAAPRGE